MYSCASLPPVGTDLPHLALALCISRSNSQAVTMHDWQNWAIPALAVLLVPLFAAIWRAAERLALLEQKFEQQHIEINTHADQRKILDSRLDGQITTLN